MGTPDSRSKNGTIRGVRLEVGGEIPPQKGEPKDLSTRGLLPREFLLRETAVLLLGR